MKKKIALLVAVTLCLSACTQGGSMPDSAKDETEEQIQAQMEESAEGNQNAQTLEEEEVVFPQVSIETLRAQYYAEDGETVLGEVEKDCVVLDSAASGGEVYRKGAETMERLFYVSQAEADAEAESLGLDAMDQYEAMKDSEYGYFGAYSETLTYTITRLDTHLLSMKTFFYDHTGGAHGYGGEGGVNIDLVSGAELSLSQLAQEPARFMNKATEVILEELDKRQDELFDGYEQYVSDQLEQTEWYLDGGGIEFAFVPYTIGPYASGTITVCVPYESVNEYLKPEYASVQQMGVVEVPYSKEVQLATLKEGAQGFFSFELEQVEEYRSELLLNLDGETVSLDDVRMQECYLLRRPDEKIYLLFYIDMASDDYVTYLYDITEGKLTECDKIGAAMDGKNIGIDRVNLVFSLYVLGTHGSQMEYRITGEGKLEPTASRYETPYHSEWSALKLVKDLPVTVDGRGTVLPAGNSIYITALDNVETVWFETVDGSVKGEIHYTRQEDDYQIYIDGVSEIDYFESLPYVG